MKSGLVVGGTAELSREGFEGDSDVLLDGDCGSGILFRNSLSFQVFGVDIRRCRSSSLLSAGEISTRRPRSTRKFPS